MPGSWAGNEFTKIFQMIGTGEDYKNLFQQIGIREGCTNLFQFIGKTKAVGGNFNHTQNLRPLLTTVT